MNHPTESGIEARELRLTYGNGVEAVRGINLDIPAGEIYGFLGPNGAGKSTTVLMLTTLLPPTGGTAMVAGHNVSTEGAAVRRSIGAALQAVALDAFLTGREHLQFVAALHGMNRATARRRAEELLDRVGLTEAADRRVGGYSGGMKRRLDLALALVHEPRVLFLDEPTTGLDPQSRTALWEEVSRLSRDEGVTVFLTTQYLEEADVLAARVGIIDAGEIVAEGTPAELKAQYGASSVEAVPVAGTDTSAVEAVLSNFGTIVAGNPNSVTVRLPAAVHRADLVGIVRALDEAQIEIDQINQHAPSLDDVFLEKTGRTLEGAATGSDDA